MSSFYAFSRVFAVLSISFLMLSLFLDVKRRDTASKVITESTIAIIARMNAALVNSEDAAVVVVPLELDMIACISATCAFSCPVCIGTKAILREFATDT